MNTQWIGHALALVVGILMGWALNSLQGGKAPEAGAGEASEFSTLRLKRDNESLRTYIGQLENQVATWENAHAELNGQLQKTEQNSVAGMEAQIARTAENPAELGSLIGTLRSQWDAFRNAYAEKRPAPGDPGYAGYLAQFQQIVSQSAVIGAQISAMPTYEPKEFAAFHTQFAASYLGLDLKNKDQVESVVEDLVTQLNAQGLGRDSFPEDRSKMRDWIQNRNEFERQSTKIVAQALPPDAREAYIQAFDDDIFDSGVRDMMRDIYRFVR